KLENLSIKKLYEQLELPIAKILALMEYNGILVNVKTLESIRKEFTKKIEAIIDKCRVYTKEINLNSPKQLATILFKKLKLPAIKKTKTGFSTNNETLRKLSKFHPLPSLIIDYREYTKFKTSYLDSFPSFIASDNRIHTTYNQINVDTGRLSSNNPNLQNIPTRSEEGKRLRKIFVASPGYQLVSFDYSQIELRVMAHMSKDKNLTEAFNSGLDIHKQTAALIFGIEEALVSSDMRRKAKVINFGIMYGMSPYGLSKELNISLNEAKQFINNYFKNYMGVKQWIDKTIKFARDNQYVRTLKGRIRYIPTINSKNKNEFEFAKRIAINTPIQGSAAELIKMAMIDIYKKYGNSEDVKMLLQIHDELIFEIRNNFMNEIDVIKNIMESTIHLNVPLVVTVGKGKSWFEASK
ncbi:DNA polymerase I, partial [candidate division TA06 bacterium]